MKKSSIANKKKKEKKNLQPYLVYPIGLNGVGLLKVMMQGACNTKCWNMDIIFTSSNTKIPKK